MEPKCQKLLSNQGVKSVHWADMDGAGVVFTVMSLLLFHLLYYHLRAYFDELALPNTFFPPPKFHVSSLALLPFQYFPLLTNCSLIALAVNKVHKV